MADVVVFGVETSYKAHYQCVIWASADGLNDCDKKLGFNWTYWYDAIKPLLKEIEYMARKVNGRTYVLTDRFKPNEVHVYRFGG